ncbi:unnamed protein product, partial [Rotaria magnacalcarata]
MSSIDYSDDRGPLRESSSTRRRKTPPPPEDRSRGGVFGRTNYYRINYQGNYQNNDRRNDNYGNPNYYGRNVYYNRNYRPQRRFNDNRNYPPQRRYNDYPRNVRSRNNGNRQQQQQGRRRSLSRQPRQQSRRRPRQIILDDFMPEELRDRSSSASNPPVESNNAPPEALPQREIFRTKTTVAENSTNTTQPFRVTEEEKEDNARQQRTTTASYRRRQRRMNRQQYRQNDNNNRRNVPRDHNRFNALAQDEEEEEEIEYEKGINNNKDDYEPLSTKKNIDKKKKTHLYLDPNRIFKWFEENSKNSKNVIHSRGNQAYIAATASTYDSWIRDNYELQVWKAYLKVSKEQKHWAKEVIQRTKHRDDLINERFVQKKINRLNDNITEATATITNVQIQLSTYWMQNTTEATQGGKCWLQAPKFTT